MIWIKALCSTITRQKISQRIFPNNHSLVNKIKTEKMTITQSEKSHRHLQVKQRLLSLNENTSSLSKAGQKLQNLTFSVFKIWKENKVKLLRLIVKLLNWQCDISSICWTECFSLTPLNYKQIYRSSSWKKWTTKNVQTSTFLLQLSNTLCGCQTLFVLMLCNGANQRCKKTART